MLAGSRVRLVGIEKQHFPFLHKIYDVPRNMFHFYEEPIASFDELEEILENHCQGDKERYLIVESVETNEQVGVLGLTEIDSINSNCEIDIIIADEFQGRGFGKHAFVLGVKYGFDVLNLHKVYLQVLPTLEAARKIYEYTGFRKEGTLKKEVFINGEYHDVFRMYMLEAQWARRKKQLESEVGFIIEERRELQPRRIKTAKESQLAVVPKSDSEAVLLAGV